jgi:hypothetical protein
VFKLALAFGEPKPLELLKRLSSKEIALWQAYDNLYPFGQNASDFLIAQLTSIMYNMWKSKESPPISTEEFLGISEPLTEEYVASTIRAFKHGTH